MKVAFYTLGCKVNQYETNAMIQKFIEAENEIVSFDDKADVYIVNTCTVTNMADRKSRQILRKAKVLNNKALIVTVGCYSQTHKEEASKIKEIDLVLGNNEKNRIVEIVRDFITKQNEQNVQVEDINTQKEYLDFGTITYTEKTRATLKIQDGCNNFCSYCLIPYARGRIRSRKKESILKEINEITKKGIKEIVITGIHIASYGKDLEDDYYLIDLLEDINKIENLKRIRIGSLEPNIITGDFVKRLVKLEKICNHFHLSLQSGCNETLKRMNRKYNTTQFMDSVNLLRKYFIDAALTADVIVGFPGETKEEFEDTYKFLEKINFTKMHIFKYSPREGTRAATMKNQVDIAIKEERSQKLIKLSNENEKKFLEKQIGKKLEVLFEKQDDNFCKGHTTNYLVVKKKEKNLENKICSVIIEKRQGLELFGK